MTVAMQSPDSVQRQEGWVLIIGLVILAMLSTLGISLMRSTQLEEKMAGASREINLSFQAAESALRDAEAFIEAQTAITVFDTTGNGIYKVGTLAADLEPDPFATTTAWNATDSREYGTAGVLDLAGVAQDPRYMIKRITDVGGAGAGSAVITGAGSTDLGSSVTVFRITARGTGGAAGGQTILRSYYGKAFN